jgi:hypothetical protein
MDQHDAEMSCIKPIGARLARTTQQSHLYRLERAGPDLPGLLTLVHCPICTIFIGLVHSLDTIIVQLVHSYHMQ